MSKVPLSETALPILAILVGDFCNKICQLQTCRLIRLSLLCASSGILVSEEAVSTGLAFASATTLLDPAERHSGWVQRHGHLAFLDGVAWIERA